MPSLTLDEALDCASQLSSLHDLAYTVFDVSDFGVYAVLPKPSFDIMYEYYESLSFSSLPQHFLPHEVKTCYPPLEEILLAGAFSLSMEFDYVYLRILKAQLKDLILLQPDVPIESLCSQLLRDIKTHLLPPTHE